MSRRVPTDFPFGPLTADHGASADPVLVEIVQGSLASVEAEAGYVDTPVLPRSGLLPGDTVDGPAVIEEYGSTVPLHPGFVATVDDWGNLLVRRTEAQA